jgi:hypothetical protein
MSESFVEFPPTPPSIRPANGQKAQDPTLEDKVDGIAVVVGRLDRWAESEIEAREGDAERFAKIESQLADVKREVQAVGTTVLARLDELLRTRCPACPMVPRPPG